MTAPPRHQRAQGRAVLAFRRDADTGDTRLADLYQSHPMRVLFPRPGRGDPVTAVLTTVSGGIAGGDRVDIDITAGPGTSVLSLPQAAEKIYRAADPTPARIDLALAADPGAALEYLPQETILFDGARLDRRTGIDLADGSAHILAGEITVFGRGAMGEVLRSGSFREFWHVRIGGRIVWRDAFALNRAAAENRFGLNGATAMASLICIAGDLKDLRDTVRNALGAHADITAAASIVGPVLLVRFLGRDPAALRRAYFDIWGRLRSAALDRPVKLPALIHC